MKTLRFYKWAAAALLILNIITLFFLWTGAKHHGPPGRNDLVDLLSLEGEKKTKILALQDVHFKEKDKLIDKSSHLHEELFAYFNDPKKDAVDVSTKINQIVENQREIEQMTFDYFKKVSSYCSSEQKAKLQGLIHKVLRPPGGRPPKND
jgi:hypothetical protein